MIAEGLLLRLRDRSGVHQRRSRAGGFQLLGMGGHSEVRHDPDAGRQHGRRQAGDVHDLLHRRLQAVFCKLEPIEEGD